MIEKFDIAGYCRISVDEEQNRDNTSIENQKAIIEDYVRQKFPGSSLTFYEDRDRSGYTFEQREGYQKMRKQLLSHKLDILIVKDFSRFSRRNSRGLVELEDLRDYGVRIISISSRTSPDSRAATAEAWWSWRTCAITACASSPLVTESTSRMMTTG